MDVVYTRGSATASDVVADLGDPTVDASIRKLIRILENKGWLTHARRGLEHVYRPTLSKHRAKKAALQHVVNTFFDGAPEKAAVALLNAAKDRLSAEERARLVALIAEAEQDGR